MVIAVNFQLLAHEVLNNNVNFTLECFSRLANQYPQHQFIYIVDKSFDKKIITSKNVIPVIAVIESKSPLRFKYWINYKLPSILKKHKADVFISGGGYCSLRTAIPQCAIVNDLSFLPHPEFFTRNWLGFYKRNTAKFVAKATTIIATSQFLKQQLIDQYKVDDTKIEVAYYGISPNFKPAHWQIKDGIKETYADGVEYFLYSGPIESQKNLTLLLKAFSFFKKRQKSNMKLVIASKNVATDKAMIKSLDSFKFRQDVKIYEKVSAEILAQITTAAYALVYPTLYEGFALTLTEAMQADVPVITANNTAIPEICGDAALYMDPADFNDIADKMMLVFKDEDKRNVQIIKGRQQAALYNWQSTTALVWKAVLKCANSL